jgi:O-antigen/teichoic acid export membrane protein
MQPVRRDSIISSFFWKLLERGGVQGIQFVLAIILARLLSPKEYGTISLITIFIVLATVFVQSGLNTSLIQKVEADELDFSSVFYLSLAIAAILYLILYFSAPAISRFYSNPKLVQIVRILSVTLFFGAINSVQMAMVSRTMQFKRYFFSSLGGVIGSGTIGVILAYREFGVWALVAQQLSSNFLITAILWFTVKWRPIPAFSFTRIKKLFSFGWKLLVSGLLDAFFRNIYGLVIGRLYDAESLGYFNRGQQFPSIIASNLDGSIQSVMLPALSSRQGDIAAVKSLMRRSMRTSSYILIPLMVGLAALAKPMVSVLLTDRWLSCVPFLQIACISYALYPIHTANLTAISAVGRSDIFLKLEIIKKGITITTLIITLRFGIYAMAMGQMVCSVIATFVNSFPNRKLLGYDYLDQIRDLLPPILVALFMGACVFALGLLPLHNTLKLLLQVTLGSVIYIGLSTLCRLDSYRYLLQTVRGIMK